MVSFVGFILRLLPLRVHDPVTFVEVEALAELARPPSWDLELVLRALGSEVNLSPRALAKKTFLLLWLLPGELVSCMQLCHMLLFRLTMCCTICWILRANMVMVSNTLPRSFVVKALLDSVGCDDEERLLYRLCSQVLS